jgi:hypothetical protein
LAHLVGPEGPESECPSQRNWSWKESRATVRVDHSPINGSNASNQAGVVEFKPPAGRRTKSSCGGTFHPYRIIPTPSVGASASPASSHRIWRSRLPFRGRRDPPRRVELSRGPSCLTNRR